MDYEIVAGEIDSENSNEWIDMETFELNDNITDDIFERLEVVLIWHMLHDGWSAMINQ